MTQRNLIRPSFLLILLFTLSQVVVAAEDPVADEGWRHAVVAADHPEASQAGLEMLRRGGNVVDAAVATSFALSVVRPESCGIGGGGFMVIWNAKKKQAVAIDYRERAPAAATPDMFHGNSDDDRESESVRGGKAVAVPGTVAGLCFAAKEYGTLPLSDLLEPAIRLAKSGYHADEHSTSSQIAALQTFKRHAKYDQRFSSLRDQFLNEGQPSATGDNSTSRQWKVLQRIGQHGSAAFYEGDVADAIVQAVQDAGGIITHQDLASVQPVLRKPLRGRFRGADVFSMPPASSGGIALLQTLQALEQWETKHDRKLNSLKHNSPDYVHLVAEVMKHAFADRAEYLGDSDFVQLPTTRLLSSGYAAQTASKIDMQNTRPAEEYGRFVSADDAGTSHFSVIDADGNAVACTETINLTFGSFVVVPEYGIIMNNQMDDFAAQPGEPNAFGLMQSEANAIAPGKKPLSSMTPTIAVREGKAVFVSGASGGPRIISATIQATLNHLVFDMKPADAVSAPRFHHQWFPNRLLLESPLHDDLATDLNSRGHEVTRTRSLASNQSASLSDGMVFGGSDPRNHGAPAGF